ncbi:MAG: hypothetical protein LH613_18570 [Chamaesiphon sp.]|nr:hypothetical protein [Chamaesiphon sp.]
MRQFLSYGLIAACAIFTTALRVCAEPPPAESVIVFTGGTISNDCSDRSVQPTK